MLKYVVCAALLTGCAIRAKNAECIVSQTSTGAVVRCPDGSVATITNGAQGPQGVIGSTGADGATGATGSVGATGATGSVGAVGSTGANGSVGATGSTGSAGATGSTGVAGSPGTEITLVQFCAPTTKYPQTFSEIGLCINDQLYAVYSANDGFLSLIPPGHYSSDGINSSCSFTVGPDCEVSP